MDLRKHLEVLAHKKRVRVGIALHTVTPGIKLSLKRASEFCEVVVIGKKVGGYKHIPATKANLENVEMKAVIGGKVDALIRGQADAFKSEDALARLGGYDRQNLPMLQIMADQFGHTFFAASATHPENWTIKSKMMHVDALIPLVKSFGLKPKIGFRTLVRPGSVGKNFLFDITWEQAEYLVQHYRKKGYQARNYNIELETAVADNVNILCFATGATGNVVSRALLFLTRDPFVVYFHGGIKETIIQNNRTLQDYTNHFIVAAAFVNRKRK
ncbi:MAG: hypothetical protein Q8Q20_04915 [bacterium]|nr:hypothetical protein [bacterium]